MNNKKKGISLITLLLVATVIIAIIVIAINILKPKENNASNIIVENNSDSRSQSEIIDFDGTAFRVKDIKAKRGDEIEVEIDLLNESNFVAANFEYKYDGSSLEYINYKIGDTIKGGAMSMVNNDKDSETVLIGYVAKPDGEKIVKPGNVVTLKFKIKENLKSKKIENTFECTTLKEEDGTDVKYEVQQGKIEIN